MPTNEKIIAVWGSPHAGKTAFAVKFAENLYQRTRGAVVVLHCDLLTPTLPILFPNAREQDLFRSGRCWQSRTSSGVTSYPIW